MFEVICLLTLYCPIDADILPTRECVLVTEAQVFRVDILLGAAGTVNVCEMIHYTHLSTTQIRVIRLIIRAQRRWCVDRFIRPHQTTFLCVVGTEVGIVPANRRVHTLLIIVWMILCAQFRLTGGKELILNYYVFTWSVP
jgi:hypothetical protein